MLAVCPASILVSGFWMSLEQAKRTISIFFSSLNIKVAPFISPAPEDGQQQAVCETYTSGGLPQIQMPLYFLRTVEGQDTVLSVCEIPKHKLNRSQGLYTSRKLP